MSLCKILVKTGTVDGFVAENEKKDRGDVRKKRGAIHVVSHLLHPFLIE